MAKIQAVAVLVAILFMATVLVDQTECFITQSRELKVRAQGEIIQWGKIYRKIDFFSILAFEKRYLKEDLTLGPQFLGLLGLTDLIFLSEEISIEWDRTYPNRCFTV